MSFRSNILGQHKAVTADGVNTYIGNMATAIPTKTDLATQLGIPEMNIPIFNIVGSDIEAEVNADYNYLNGFASTAITHYRDLGGFCKSLSASTFQLCVMTDVYFAGATITSGDATNGPFREAVIGQADFPELVIAGGSMWKFGEVQIFNAEKLTTLSISSFYGTKNVQVFNTPLLNDISASLCLGLSAGYTGVAYLPYALYSSTGASLTNLIEFGTRIGVEWLNYTTIGNNTTIGTSSSFITNKQVLGAKLSISTIYIPEFIINGTDIETRIIKTYTAGGFGVAAITSFLDYDGKCIALASNGFYGAGDITINFPAVTSIGVQCFRNANILNAQTDFPELLSVNDGFKFGSIGSVDAPKLTTLIGFAFYNAIRAGAILNFPLLATIGASTISNGVFNAIAATATLNVPIALQTADAGAEEGDIAYCRGRGCTINYV
jgi:hypothetical protein